MAKKFFIHDNPNIVTHYIYLVRQFFDDFYIQNLLHHITTKINNRHERLVIHIDELDIIFEENNKNIFVKFYEALKELNNKTFLSIVIIGSTNNIKRYPIHHKIGSRFSKRIFISPPSAESVQNIINNDQKFLKLFQQLNKNEQAAWIKDFVQNQFSLRQLKSMMLYCVNTDLRNDQINGYLKQILKDEIVISKHQLK